MTDNQPIKRDTLAQDIMTLFYQDLFVSSDQPFDIDFFIRAVNDSYEAILRQEYIDTYSILRKNGEHLVQLVTFDTKWLRSETLELKKDEPSGLWKVTPGGKIFSFPFDQSSVGIQDVRSVRYNDCNLVRADVGTGWQDKHMPDNSVTSWWPEGDDIFFDKDCCKKIRVFYVPVPDETLQMQQGLANQIKEYVLKLMFAAKEGNVPDMTDDNNPIRTPQSEMNKETVQK